MVRRSDNLDLRHGEDEVPAAGEELGLALEDAALDVLLGIRARGPFDLVHTLDDGASLLGQHLEDFPARPAVLPREDDDDVSDANNVLVPDGNYKLWIQYAEDSGQGPHTTNGLTWTKGPVAKTNDFADILILYLRRRALPASPRRISRWCSA